MTPDTIIAATHYALRFTVLHRLDEEFHSARGPKELRALYFRTLNSLSPLLKLSDPYSFTPPISDGGEAALYWIAALAMDELIQERMRALWPDGVS